MEITTFKEDLLGLEEFGDRLKQFINVDHHFVQGSLVVALSSKFGSGKTTFLRMWQSKLGTGEEKRRPFVISLNAWETDYCGDPLFAIVSALADSIKSNDTQKKAIVEAAKDVGWFVAAMTNQLVDTATGFNPMEAGEIAEGMKAKRAEGNSLLPTDAFSAYQGRKQAMERLKGAIKTFVEGSESMVLFLVDELDRCRPDYAISYLETIKHIFDMQGVVFILAADREQLANSAKTAFGSDLDFEEYYRKFIHREVALPAISDHGYRRLAKAYVSEYLKRDGLRWCGLKIADGTDEHIVELISKLRLTPRQIQEVFRILGHIFETSQTQDGKLYWQLGLGAIALAAFKVGNRTLFDTIGARRLEPKEAFEFWRDFIGEEFCKWWFEIFLALGGLTVKDPQTVERLLKGQGLIGDTDTIKGMVIRGGPSRGGSGRLAEIHDMIEQVAQWR